MGNTSLPFLAAGVTFVELLDKAVECPLLFPQVLPRSTGVLLEDPVHALVPSVLRRMARLYPLRPDTKLKNQTDRLDNPPNPTEANGDPLSVLMASGSP